MLTLSMLTLSHQPVAAFVLVTCIVCEGATRPC